MSDSVYYVILKNCYCEIMLTVIVLLCGSHQSFISDSPRTTPSPICNNGVVLEVKRPVENFGFLGKNTNIPLDVPL